MPKKNNKSFWGGRGRQNNSEKDHYFGHDDRMGRSNDGQHKFNNSNKFNKPRVSFKKQYKSDISKRNHLIKQHLDDDVLMSGSNNNSRQIVNRGRGGRGFPRGRNSPLPHGDMRDGRPRIFAPGDSGWHKIIIPHGQKYPKEFVLGNLLSLIAPLTFTPVMYKVIGIDAIFYIEDQRVAAKLADCDRRITTADGYKMQVRVRQGVPPIEISDNLKERLKQVMAKRYVLETNALDLSKFSQDLDLVGDYWCPLSRPNMLLAVLEIVHEHIPNLGALNLDSNKMHNVEKLGSKLVSKFDKLKILYIGDNRIKEMNHLNTLKGLPLEELRLAGNPVCIKYKNRQDDYVNDVRKIFPKLLRLDGKDLPPPIGFDLEDDKLKLPPPQKMCIVDDNFNAQEVAKQFLQQYFMVFDSENRQPLLNAYHEHAIMSLTTNIPQSSGKFGQYRYESRNLTKVLDATRRKKLLKHGRLPIVSFISEMPRTKHDLNSFTMDLSLVMEGMMLITVTGLFKEVNTGSNKDSKEQMRYFQRVFIIVPEGSGFCISNERLHISNPTSEQEKIFSDTPLVTQPTPGPSTVPTAVGTSVSLSEEVKQQMTMTLSQQTNMNIEWSLRCLGEVQWDFERARVAFQEAFAQGKIPPEAFTK